MNKDRISGIGERLEIILVNEKKKEGRKIKNNQCPWSRQCNRWGKYQIYKGEKVPLKRRNRCINLRAQYILGETISWFSC